jgi:hypothetical protein
MIRIQTIDLDDVMINNKIKYNVNNLYDKQPDDYREKIDMTYTKNWVDKFHVNYSTITLDEYDLKWMHKAFLIGRVTAKFPQMYNDDLDDLLEKYKEYDYLFKGTPYFIRTESVSLKCGVHGAGPYTNLRMIIESMTTSRSGHCCFREGDMQCKIYLLKWIPDMSLDKEFRIFVFNNNITAISQQHLYQVNTWLSDESDAYIKQVIKKIVDYFRDHIRSKMLFMSSYVMDLALIGDNDAPYFIEPNSFGKEYASGSALFHWVDDEDLIYNKNGDLKQVLTFRYVN